MSGVKDFFGKKLGGWVYEAAAHLSPVELRAGQIGADIASSFEKDGMLGAGGSIFGAMKSAIGSRGDYSVGDWFAGRNIGETAGSITNSVRNARLGMRVGIPAAIGLLGASNLVAPDNPFGNMAGTALQVAGHTAIAGALGSRMGWGYGAAYAGWSAVNALRPGDQIGPF